MEIKPASLKKDSGPKTIRVNLRILKKIEKKYGTIQKYLDFKINEDFKTVIKISEPRKK